MACFYNVFFAILLILPVILLSFPLRGRPAEGCVSFRQTVTGDGPFPQPDLPDQKKETL